MFYKAFIKAELDSMFLRATFMRESKTREWLRHRWEELLGTAFCNTADSLAPDFCGYTVGFFAQWTAYTYILYILTYATRS